MPTPPVASETIRVVVVDDSEEVRRLVRRAFAHDETVEIVGEAGDGAEAITVVSVTRPDVVVMDIQMPGTDGIAATRQIKAEYPAIEVIAFSSDDSGQAEMVDAGASDFAFKGEPIGELAKTIRSLAAMKRASSERHDIPPFVLEAITHVAPAPGPSPHEGISEWPGYVPFDLSAEFELYPRAKERFLSLSEAKQREIISYVNDGSDGRREMRIGNVVMSLDD